MINEFSGFSVINIFENELNLKCIKWCIKLYFLIYEVNDLVSC